VERVNEYLSESSCSVLSGVLFVLLFHESMEF